MMTRTCRDVLKLVESSYELSRNHTMESPSAYVWSSERLLRSQKDKASALLVELHHRPSFCSPWETATTAMGTHIFPFLVLKLYSEDKVRLEPVTSVQPLKAQQEVGA